MTTTTDNTNMAQPMIYNLIGVKEFKATSAVDFLNQLRDYSFTPEQDLITYLESFCDRLHKLTGVKFSLDEENLDKFVDDLVKHQMLKIEWIN